MTWTEEQLAEMKVQSARIGFQPGDLIPTPADYLTPDDVLTIYRAVPDGSRVAGLIKAMANFRKQ